MLFAGAGRKRALGAAVYQSWNSHQVPQPGGKGAVPTHPLDREVCTGLFAPQIRVLSLLQPFPKQVQTGSMAVA